MASKNKNKNKNNKKNKKKSSSSACSKKSVYAVSKQADSKGVSIAQAIQRAIQHHQAGQIQEAENLYQQVLSIDANHSEANHLLGLIAYQGGKNEDAVQLIQKSIKANPDNADAHHNLGLIHMGLDNLDASIASYRAALSINSNRAETHNNLGNVFHQAGKVVEAISSFKKAISLKPDFAEAHGNLGNAFKDLGELDKAISSLKNSVSLKRDFTEAHYSLTYLKKFTEVDDDVRAMQVLYAHKDISDRQKIYISFSLGKAYEDMKDYEKAFDYFLEGNRLKRMTYEYSISQQKDFFSKVKEVFTKSFFANNTGAGNNNDTPIFIVGMPRSGTSLVEQILASHSQVYGAGELRDMHELVKSMHSTQSTNEFPACVLDFNKGVFQDLGSQYIEGIRRHSEVEKHITDKMPENFMLIGLIKIILPSAKIIHCMRDPMDNCLSIFKTYFSELDEYAYDMIELGQYYIFI